MSWEPPAKGGKSEGSAHLKGQKQTAIGDVLEGGSALRKGWLIKLLRRWKIEVKVLRGQCEVQGM